MIKWHKADKLNRLYVPLKDGKKIAMPRYYKEKIYQENELKYIHQHLYIKALEEKMAQSPADDTKNEYIRIKKAITKENQRIQTKL